MTDLELVALDATALADKVRAREISARELAEATRDALTSSNRRSTRSER